MIERKGRPWLERDCLFCGKHFKTQYKHTLYCSHTGTGNCKDAWHMSRNKDKQPTLNINKIWRPTNAKV